MRYLFTHLDDLWTLTVIHLRLSLIPIVIGLLIAVPLGALIQRTTALRRLTTITASIIFTIPSLALFVVLREGASLDDDLRARIAGRVRADCSPRHVPDDLYAVAEVPRTLSGKVLEVPVKRILTGTPPEKAASRDSLANPKALDWFVELAAKRGR